MEEGFYRYRRSIYYGSYDEKQVSGRLWISKLKSYNIQTNRPICEDDWAVILCDNHRILEPEYADLQAMLLKMGLFMNLNTKQAVDFSMVEERLSISLPKELKQIYMAIHNHEEYFTSVEHFLPLNEIYIEQGIIVFFKKKRAPLAGYDLDSGRLAFYYKKEWKIEGHYICCVQFCVGRMLVIALENKPVVKKARCKGKFVTTLDIKKELECFCNEKYHLLSEFNMDGIAIMYSDEKLLAWIRSNGFYADIHVGSVDETHLEAFGEHLGQTVWK
ncbi:hypothetical protein H8S75_00830 [Hungatella sp. L12]|uniref:DUF4313 domain-containing protein n=1 Tax=Hungatella hominis TaxID=2763050 RepID=A0ABR7H039_9FIRM|nr:hypothetical protein [Hungatella hominis]MBC5706503.1 hypothetical protein [Hungatella hominis]